ncbi:DUF3995 domain-containing protein [Bacillus ndiopicus]|uniref:DUF3995 domain-containing protein n=1 Tax=Bacillus ndiopicus TaxID=1347368 RepID=UPI0005AB01FA|nr:DUF3995 domain-containing protein [Bacillus ndiopicus]
MTYILSLVAIGLLWIIALLHIYWAFGGHWGTSVVIPSKVGTQHAAFHPRRFGTCLVALLLFCASSIIAIQGGLIQILQANKLSSIACLVCAIVFLIRAIGDFRYVGFFKTIRHSRFAKYDTWLFSPFCIFLSYVYFQLL